MRPRDWRRSVSPMRVFLIASAVTAIAAAVIAGERLTVARSARPPEIRLAVLGPSAPPIAAEAQVFRTAAGMLAIDPTDTPSRSAHPRTLATWRALRAYPGAPPRIPHGLTPREFQSGGCRACHERGGFSQRFGAYVPLTPHPEMGACLQCHVGDSELMAIPLPGLDPSARCHQCHSSGGMRWRDSSLNWMSSGWPRLAPLARGAEPPAIPHALDMRGNCLTCHAAPAGVAEIRTTHPERANCRQCHVAASAATDNFVRRASVAAAAERVRSP